MKIDDDIRVSGGATTIAGGGVFLVLLFVLDWIDGYETGVLEMIPYGIGLLILAVGGVKRELHRIRVTLYAQYDMQAKRLKRIGRNTAAAADTTP